MRDVSREPNRRLEEVLISVLVSTEEDTLSN